jgi:O-antigen/teichoic acid export membrane protein
LVFTSFQGLFSSLLRAIKKFYFDAMLKIINALTLIGGVIIIVFFDYGLEGLMYAQILGQLLVLVICLMFYAKRYKFEYPLYLNFKKFFIILKKSLPFAVIAIILPVYYQINIVMLSKLSGYEVTGVFTASYKIILMFMMLSRLLSQVLFPTLSTLFVVSIEKFEETFMHCYRGIALVVFPIAFALCTIGDKIILIFFGSEFIEAVLPLRIMTFSLLFSSLHMILITALNSSNREKDVARVVIFATIANIIINLLLIPRLGSTGAGIAVFTSEIIKYCGSYYYFRKRLFKIGFLNEGIKILIACFGMTIFIGYLDEIALPVLILISGLLYLFLLWLLGVLSNNQITYFFNMFTTKKSL